MRSFKRSSGLLSVFFFLLAIMGQYALAAPALGPLVRVADLRGTDFERGGPPDEVVFMNQEEAKSYCRSRNLRLPEIRTIAEVLNLQGVHEQAPAVGDFAPIWRARGVVEFFYERASYSRPGPGAQGEYEYWFWSSSPDPSKPEFAYFFDPRNGAIGSGLRVFPGAAVRCAAL
jgi:hypothetical protein